MVLADSNVRELAFYEVEGVDGKRLGGSDMLCLYYCDNETLAAVGLGVGRIKRLALEDSTLDNASLEQICLALKSPSNELRELKYEGDTESSIEDQLVPALKHPNCNLAELSFLAYGPERKKAAKRVEDMFRNRRALFVLLQGRQVKRRYCPLRRLPVEMFRLVGMVLL